ncbi:hypothetical protein VC83_05408 [Pseudogymnoascus destructans]|uniref:Methyltransferase domain-containing protein n=2 Tax=Pseudogymnoascus destructans TaxID=655981 RepID=L8G8A9_PSED2|nr:uncharacterized protein VC83_05408 [Pseudogymnoascus destructans]ELR09079.1 hypothetical protein GMDG_03663 [Pseudogymnoascus destructans 20631-21]OAF57987.1 hypothetical protein VC83_05408 [Pseudogymnoascus destructans]
MLATRPLRFILLVAFAIFVITLLSGYGTGGSLSWLSTSSVLSHDVARVSLRGHMRLAEKIWSKTVEQRHNLLAEWQYPENMPLFPADSPKKYPGSPYSIWDFAPASWSCPYEMERIGRMGDGGKWVCGMSKYEELPATRPCVIYSFGVQTESSYEDETIERTNCEIWAYDYSVTNFGKQLSYEHRARAHFTQAGISGVTNATSFPPFYTIQDLMKTNGHDYIDILKMDIEYAEFASLSSLDRAFPEGEGFELPIGQLMVELHLFGHEEMTAYNFLQWWETLEARGLRPVWTEPNLLYTTMRIERGDPRLAEYTLVNIKDRRSVLFKGLN